MEEANDIIAQLKEIPKEAKQITNKQELEPLEKEKVEVFIVDIYNNIVFYNILNNTGKIVISRLLENSNVQVYQEKYYLTVGNDYASERIELNILPILYLYLGH